jgi:hypothetical protein
VSALRCAKKNLERLQKRHDDCRWKKCSPFGGVAFSYGCLTLCKKTTSAADVALHMLLLLLPASDAGGDGTFTATCAQKMRDSAESWGSKSEGRTFRMCWD